MNKKVLAKVLGAVLAISIVDNVGAWGFSSLTNMAKKAYHKVAGNNEVQKLGGTAISDVLQGKDPRSDLKRQAEGDAVNAVAKKVGIAPVAGNDGNEDAGQDQGATGDEQAATQPAPQAPAEASFDGIVPATVDNTSDGEQLTDNSSNPVWVDNQGNLYSDANGTAEDASNYDVDNDSNNPILYDSNNNKYGIDASGYAHPIGG